MKKFLFLLLCVNYSFAQEIKPISFEGTLETTKSKKEIYLNSREWFFKNFNSYEGVISLEDYENGVFYAKGVISNVYRPLTPTKLFSYVLTGDIKFSMRMYFKDNKYKFIIDNFIHSDKVYIPGGTYVSGSTVDRGFGLVTESEEGMSSSKVKVHKELISYINAIFNGLVIDFNKSINDSNINDY